MNLQNIRDDLGMRTKEVNYLKGLGLRDDEIRYLSWLRVKSRIRERRKFR